MHRFASVLVLSTLSLALGCSSDDKGSMKSDSSMAKSDMARPVVAEKDMTHTLTADTMYGMEMGGPMNAGVLKKDTRVMLMMPGSMAQVMTADGKKIFIDGSKLQALGK